MIQILAQRLFPGMEAPVFVYTDPPLILPSLSAVYKNYHAVLEKLPESERYNLFYTLAHHAGANSSGKPSRLKSTFEYQGVIGFDIDGVDRQRALEYAAIVGRVLQAPTAAFTVVSTGAGLHVLAGLRSPIRTNKFFDENRDAYKEICKLVTSEIQKLELPLEKIDTGIFEPARVFRLPGSENRKPGRPNSPCTLVQYSEALLELDLTVLSGLKDRSKENISPAEIRRQYPVPDFKEMVKECRFVQWTLEKTAEVHEPQAFDLFSLLVPQPEVVAETSVGPLTPRQLAEYVFKNANASASLKSADFDEKWEQAKNYGGRKCTTIGGHWLAGCERCPHFGKIPTPLALKSKEHVASESLGFWVLGSKGQHLHPAYEDLAKVYRANTKTVVMSDGRIFAHTGKLYRETADLEVKGWLETILVPSEPLRETHRNEFLSKIKAGSAVGGVVGETFFEDSILGKLNCNNGTLDIIQGVLSPHDTKHGFKYVLPYDYEPGKESEYFLDWLDVISGSRVDLMESLLDVMAYMLWPNFDDHLFTYLVGDGSNGKSTFIELLQKIVGKDNYSNVGIQQLARNRFAPANLEGKLVNLSEESSGTGKEIDFEGMNVIKTLAAGGTLQVERKGQDGFSFKNLAKLIFSANYPPKFQETGHAITRRMLIIPFDYKISIPDPTVKTKLFAEVPAILSMLIRRIQDNVGKNGHFVVYRGGATAEVAKQNVLYATSNVVEWAKETVESRIELGKDTYIAVDDSYAHYRAWCERNGYRYPVTKNNFGRTMCASVISKAQGTESQAKKVAGKTVRVYPFTRYKEGALDASIQN